MWEQPRVKPLARSDFFADEQSARPVPEHTVARGEARAADPAYYAGILGGTRVPINISAGTPVQTGIFRGAYLDAIPARALAAFPGATTRDRWENMLLRGQNRFDIYCSPCHGRLGDGNGMIAIRGLNLRRQPANYHTQRLRKMPLGHFYDVLTNGFGLMLGYGTRIPDPNDRWAVVAYIRALQLSQDAGLGAVPASERGVLTAPSRRPTPAGGASPVAGPAAAARRAPVGAKEAATGAPAAAPGAAPGPAGPPRRSPRMPPGPAVAPPGMEMR
ncbi:MAG: cytochrome c [Chthonomonadales bacterium]|nr:cytochrome c [Chthonomonadales bacterium]